MTDKKSNEEKTKRVHLNVTGIVQGVGFRLHTVALARQLGLTGWTKNLVDGSVEIIVEGNKKSVEKFLLKIRHGNPSRVDKCHVVPEIPTGEFIGFEIRY